MKRQRKIMDINELILQEQLMNAGLPPSAVILVVGGSEKGMAKFQHSGSIDYQKIKELAAKQEWRIDENMRDLILNKSGIPESDLTLFRRWCEEHPVR